MKPLVEALYLPADGIRVGDTGFAKTPGKVGILIRFGEWLRWRNDAWNHVFTVVETDGTPANTIIVQATPARGIIQSPLADVTHKGIVGISHPPVGVDPTKVVEFVLGEVGNDYGFGSNLCIAIDIVTFESFPSVRMDNTWCCSALGAEANRAGGWIQRWGCIYTVSPTTLWLAWPQTEKEHIPCDIIRRNHRPRRPGRTTTTPHA